MIRYISLFLTLAAAGLRSPGAVPSTVPDLPGLPESQEAPAAFDFASNGVVDDTTHQADRTAFDAIEEISDGLGPLYNAQSCRECHQNPASGGVSQVAELARRPSGSARTLRQPERSDRRGTVIITGRTLINDRAICPSAAFPDQEIQERVPVEARPFVPCACRSVLFGDGFVEAVPDETLLRIAAWQCRETKGASAGRPSRCRY